MRCLLTGQAALETSIVVPVLRILSASSCEDPDGYCERDREYCNVRRLADRVRACSVPKSDILASFRAFSKEVEEANFCDYCIRDLKSALSTQEIWENLSKFFALN